MPATDERLAEIRNELRRREVLAELNRRETESLRSDFDPRQFATGEPTLLQRKRSEIKGRALNELFNQPSAPVPQADATVVAGVGGREPTEDEILGLLGLKSSQEADRLVFEAQRNLAPFLAGRNPDFKGLTSAIQETGFQNPSGFTGKAGIFEFVLDLINRGQVSPASFSGRTGGAIQSAISGATGGLVQNQDVPFENPLLDEVAEVAGVLIPVTRLLKLAGRGAKTVSSISVSSPKPTAVGFKIGDESIIAGAKPIRPRNIAEAQSAFKQEELLIKNRVDRFANIARQKERVDAGIAAGEVGVKVSADLPRRAFVESTIENVDNSFVEGVTGVDPILVRGRSQLERHKVQELFDITNPKQARLNNELRGPAIFQSEVGALRRLEVTQPQGKIGRFFETPLFVHERLGTKELFYRPQKAAERLWVLKTKTDKNQLHAEATRLGLKVNRDVNRRIMAFATSRQEGGLEILKADGFKRVPTLTSAERQYYDYMRARLVDKFDDINGARTAMGLQSIKPVKNYFTFFRNFDDAIESGIRFDQIPHTMSDKFGRGLRDIKPGTLKQRGKERYGGLSYDATGVFERYMERSNKYISEMPVGVKQRKLVNEIKLGGGQTLRETNPNTHEFLNAWIDANSGLPTDPTMFDPLLRRLIHNNAFFVMSGNIRSAVTQLTATVPATSYLGPRYMIEGFGGLMNTQTSATVRRFIHANSKVLPGRIFDVAVVDALRGTGVGGKMVESLARTKQFVGEKGLKPLQFLDKIVAQATWYGAYRKGRQVYNFTRKEAVNFADDAVTRTQGSGVLSDRSRIQRSILGRAVTQFQTFTINNANFILKDVIGIKGAKIGGLERARRWAYYGIGATIVESIYEDMVGAMSPMTSPLSPFRAFRDAKDRGKGPIGALFAAALESGQDLPIVSSVRFGESAPFGAPGAIAKNAFRLATDPSLGNAFSLGGRVFGLPIGRQIEKTTKFLVGDKKKTSNRGGRSGR